MRSPLRSAGSAALATALAATGLALLAGLLGWRWVTLGGVVLAAALEPYVAGIAATVESVLARAALDRLPRMMLRVLAVLLVGTSVWTGPGVAAAYGWTAVAFIGADTALVLLLVYVEHARTPVVLVRNVDLPVPALVPAPPPGVSSRTAARLGLLELAVLVPSLLVPSAALPQWVLGGAAVVVLLVLDGWLALAARAVGGSLRGPGHVRRVQQWLGRYAPEVLLYFGGSAESAYQLTMWLTTLERLPQRTLLLLRDPKVLAELPASSLPVLCVPGSVDLMSLDLGSAHLALFAANVGNGLHVMRLPHLMTVFIGHGDSDKSASASPFAKAYDEIWVAGPAARDRYRRARVGVRDDSIVEVGRPQLDELREPTARPEGSVPTLLYAPTWEGWNAEQHYTSLDSLGPELVASALSYPGEVRVIYKPHPFTGRRDPRIARAHARIVTMLEAANAAGGRPAAGSGIAGLTADALVDDGLDGAFSHATRSALEFAAEREAAETRYWAGRDPAAHVVVGADGPSLYSCFRQADALVSDVSSVITDFAATGRPYAVTNPTGVPADRFVSMFPAASAGAVLDSGDDVHALLDVLAGAAPDTFTGARAALRASLLGDSEPDATTRFAQAVESLLERGRAREQASIERGMLTGFATSGHGPADTADDD